MGLVSLVGGIYNIYTILTDEIYTVSLLSYDLHMFSSGWFFWLLAVENSYPLCTSNSAIKID